MLAFLLIISLLGFGWWYVTHHAAPNTEAEVKDQVVPVATIAPKHHHRKHS